MVDQPECKTLADVDVALHGCMPGAHLEGSKIILADGSGIGHQVLKAWVNAFAFLGLASFMFLFGSDNWFGHLLVNLLLLGALLMALLSIKMSIFHFSVRKRLRELLEQEASDE